VMSQGVQENKFKEA